MLVGQQDERDANLCETGAQTGETQHGVAPVAVGDTTTEEKHRDHRDQGRSGDCGQPGRTVGDLQDAEGQGDRRHGAASQGDRLARQEPAKSRRAERLPGREAGTGHRCCANFRDVRISILWRV